MTRKGQCLCGAVRFTAHKMPETFGICHCPMCQRWTGSALYEVSVPEDQVTWEGPIQVFTSSDWGERAFCPTCGSGLYFRMTQQGEWSGNYDIPLGLFEDASDLTLSHEIYVDHALMEPADRGQVKLTRAECVAKFPTLDARP